MKYLVSIVDFETTRGFMWVAKHRRVNTLGSAWRIVEKNLRHFIVKNGGAFRKERWGACTRTTNEEGPRRWATITMPSR